MDGSRRYDTDLSDAAWALVAPLLPPARPGGRPRTTDLRAVVDAILTRLLRTGCQWRLLPRDFSPSSSPASPSSSARSFASASAPA